MKASVMSGWSLRLVLYTWPLGCIGDMQHAEHDRATIFACQHSTGGVLDARIGASHRYGMDWTDYPESSVRSRDCARAGPYTCSCPLGDKVWLRLKDGDRWHCWKIMHTYFKLVIAKIPY